MNKFYYGLLSLMLAGLVSCAKDEGSSSFEGRIDVRVNTDQSLSETVSRASEEEAVPEAKDFALTIESVDGELSNSWANLENFEPVSVPVGTYNVTASYGDADAEGFDALSYLGTTSVEVKKDETSEASVTCTINKAKVSISYTDDFKAYFSSYSAYVTSSKGNKVTYAADEALGAYFVPGDLGVYLEVTRQGVSQKVTLNPKNFTAEVKHEYRLTMDVDASTASLNIIFNDNPASEQNVNINISDEALNAPAPEFIPTGFTSGTAIEVLEENSVSGKLEAYLNAASSLAKCELVTASEALKAQGWPETVDLMKLTAEQSQKLTELGLVTRGLGANHDKIATIDFQNVISHLYCTSDGNDTHTFTLRATDLLSKVSEDLVLKVTTRNNGFAITLPESVPYGSSAMTFSMNLEGDPSQAKFYYEHVGAWQQFTSDKISVSETAENQYSVTISYPTPLVDTEKDVKFRAEYGTSRVKKVEGKVKVEDPELTLSLKNGDADVWATKAYLQVTASAAKSRASRTISSSTVEIQYKDGETWKIWPHQSYDAETGLFLLTSLGEGATETNGVPYTLRAVYKRGGEVTSVCSNEISFETESMLQMPNSGFDNWYTDTDKYLFTSWYLYYPYLQGEKDIWWATNNERAQAWTAYPVDITTCPAVIYTYDTRTGTGKAAEIHTACGGEYANTAQIVYSESAFAGSLFIGTYSWSDKTENQTLGHAFDSRPDSLSFWYKYKPYNQDAFRVYVEVKSGQTVIATGEYIPEESSTEDINYQYKSIELIYTNTKLKATNISVQFLSTKKTSFKESDLNKNASINLTDCSDDWHTHLGSFLKIDDVKLIY